MIKTVLIACAAALLHHSCEVVDKSKKEDRIVIIRHDNDFSTLQDSTVHKTESMPVNVSKKLDSLLDYNNEYLFQRAFKIQYANGIFIYVLRLKGPYDSIRYYLVGWNEQSDLATASCPEINGKWMENGEAGFNPKSRLVKGKMIDFFDLNQDGQNEITVKERVHNGNMYNAVIVKYFAVDIATMAITPVMTLESVQQDFLSDCLITRVLKNETIYTYRHCSVMDEEKLGEVYLACNNLNNIVIKEKNIMNEEYEGLLVTGSGIEVASFLKNGYKFIY